MDGVLEALIMPNDPIEVLPFHADSKCQLFEGQNAGWIDVEEAIQILDSELELSLQCTRSWRPIPERTAWEELCQQLWNTRALTRNDIGLTRLAFAILCDASHSCPTESLQNGMCVFALLDLSEERGTDLFLITFSSR